MNKIVREHYPVSKLPSDLREGLDPTANVTLTLEPESKRPDLRELRKLVEDTQRDRNVTTEEAVARVRELRDEWE